MMMLFLNMFLFTSAGLVSGESHNLLSKPATILLPFLSVNNLHLKCIGVSNLRPLMQMYRSLNIIFHINNHARSFFF